MNRQEHLQWAKNRALEYVELGNLADAFASLISDLRKHPELENHAAIDLTMSLYFGKHLDTAEKMRHHIEGFN